MTTSPIRPAVRRASMPLWAQILIWIILLAVLAVLAINLFRAQVPMIQPGDTVPDFTIPFYEGYEYNGAAAIQFSSLHGKVVVINFWASWCVPCEDEAVLLEQAWQAYREGGQVVFLGIDFVDTPASGRAYLEKFQITYPNGPDLQEGISPHFNRDMGVPETYFIDRQGILRQVKVGPFLSLGEIRAIIDPLLEE